MGTLYFRQLRAGRDFGCSAQHARALQNYVYMIGDVDAGEVLLVDPAWGVEELVELTAEADLEVVGALVTHCHPDHVGGNLFGETVEGLLELMELAPCPVHVHRAEAAGVRAVTGLPESELVEHRSGDKVGVGELEIELLHTPGHTPGSLCFRVADRLVAGDTLFLVGCAPVNLPGGDPEEMFRSLQRLKELPASTVVYPGHAYAGTSGTLQEAERTNDFLLVDDPEAWLELLTRHPY